MRPNQGIGTPMVVAKSDFDFEVLPLSWDLEENVGVVSRIFDLIYFRIFISRLSDKNLIGLGKPTVDSQQALALMQHGPNTLECDFFFFSIFAFFDSHPVKTRVERL